MTTTTLREQLAASIARYEAQHGPFEDLEAPAPPRCATCHDQGFIVVPHWNPDGSYTEDRSACPNPDCPTMKANRDARYRTLVAKAPLPAEYRDLRFEDWVRLNDRTPDLMKGKWYGVGAAILFSDLSAQGYWFSMPEALQTVGRTADNLPPHRKNSLILAGPPGVGKTSLAACIVNRLHEIQVPALYIRVSDLLESLKEPFNKQDADYMYEFGRTEQQILATFSRAPVLVLDEFNLARVSDYSKQKLEDIVRHRMAHQLPTVMTTNLSSFEDFNEHWGYRVGHAVQGMAHWIVMSGPELRRRAAPIKSE